MAWRNLAAQKVVALSLCLVPFVVKIIRAIKIKGKTMKKLKTVIFLSILVVIPPGARAFDVENPTGTGRLTVTNISIGSQGTTFDFEGPVENYGTVFATHYLQSVDGDRSRGTVTGEARALLEDGSMVVTPHYGTFTRSGSSVRIYFTDATNTGVVNFVVWELDVLTKEVNLKYWEVNSGD